MLTVKNLPLTRGGKTLAPRLDFSLPTGRYLELTGANGSGKTTLLRALAREPGNRTFHFASRSGLRDELTVSQQLTQSLALFAPAHNAALRLADLLQQTGLVRARALRVGELSEGQRRRLMLAVMIGAARPVWLVDEPFNALDDEGIALLGQCLETHLAQGGVAVIATHQPVAQRIAALAPRCHGTLHLAGPATHLTAAQAPMPPAEDNPHPPAGFKWVLQRELSLLCARPQDAAWPLVFHWMVVSLFPLALGADSKLLATLAPGLFWVSALLALLLGAQRLFGCDHDSGALEHMHTAGLPMGRLAAGKACSLFLAVGMPLSLSSAPFGLQFGLSATTQALLCGSMLIGLPVVCLLCVLFAALGLMARRAQLMVSLLALPAFVPVLVFGSAAATSLQAGMSPASPLGVLAALSLLTALTLPRVTGSLLGLALD